MKPEVIVASTPGFFVLIGFAFGCVAMLAPGISDANRTLGINASVGAIAAGGGLARNGNSDSANIRGDKVSIQSVQGEHEE